MGVADAAGQYLPASHAVQEVAVAPRVPRYVPGSQFVGTVMPAVLQRVPGGHTKHSNFDFAAGYSLKVPAGQFVGYCDPLYEY